MNLFKRNNWWWVNFTDAKGKRYRAPTGVQVDGQAEEARAHEAASKLVGGVLLGQGETVKSGKIVPTLAVALERTYRDHWEGSRSGYVMKRVVGLLVRECGHWPLNTVTYEKLKAYAKGLQKDGLANATINRRMSALGVVLRDAARLEEIKARPDLPRFEENNIKERFMSVEEEGKVERWLVQTRLDCARDQREEWEYIYNLFLFLLDTGFRFSEAFTFKLIDGKADLTSGKTKSARRRVPLTVRAKLCAALMLQSPIHARLIADTRPKASWDWVSHRWMTAVRAVGCTDVTLHILRHTCASRLVQRGVDIYRVSKWLGHSSVRVTERYAKLSPDSFDGALAALENCTPPSVHPTGQPVVHHAGHPATQLND